MPKERKLIWLLLGREHNLLYFFSQKWRGVCVQQHAIRENNAYKNGFLLLCSGVFVNKKWNFEKSIKMHLNSLTPEFFNVKNFSRQFVSIAVSTVL